MIQGPNGKNITLESVNEVVEYLSQPIVPDSVQSSTSKTKRKKKKEASLTGEADTTQPSHSSMAEVKMSAKKKKKKRIVQDTLANGHHTSDNEEGDGNDDVNNTLEVRRFRVQIWINGNQIVIDEIIVKCKGAVTVGNYLCNLSHNFAVISEEIALCNIS